MGPQICFATYVIAKRYIYLKHKKTGMYDEVESDT